LIERISSGLLDEAVQQRQATATFSKHCGPLESP
jgi:hypothetical protein